MRTIRARLTASYSAALTLTLAAFAAILYISGRTSSYRELDQRIRSEAELSAGILAESYRARGALVRMDPTRRPVLIPDVAALLEVVPDYLLVTAADGSLLYASADARALTFQEVETLRRLVTASLQGTRPDTVAFGPTGPSLHYAVRRVPEIGSPYGAIFAGADIRAAELEPRQLLGKIAIILPLGLLVGLLIGSWISRRALAPIDRIITEVREITDGRSLHRRLAEPIVDDELGRLAGTLNQMMARLERSFSALRRFTADASHELKTPLTVLRAGVERAMATPHLARDMLEGLEETLQEIKRMSELVDTLLTLARADEGSAPLYRESTDLRRLVEETRETGELLAEQAGVEMSVATPSGPVVIPVDAERIRELILNLLTNAVKYTPEGGHIALELGQDDGHVRLVVRDTGIGIAPGDLPHIFDRFWRADSARTRTGRRPGAGLGLAISRWIVEAHGGAIDVTSRPGRGTTVTVTLPLTDPDA